MKTFDLMFGHLGNGLTVWDRSQLLGGDYKTVAHIAAWGGVKLYDERLKGNPAAMERIDRQAAANRNSYRIWWNLQSYETQYCLWLASMSPSQQVLPLDTWPQEKPSDWLLQEYIANSNRRHGYTMPQA